MTTRSKSILSYPDAKALWDVIYQQSRINPGVDPVITPPTPLKEWERHVLIMRLYRYRTLLQNENAKIYPDGHPNHGTSIFDAFIISKVKGKDGNLAIKAHKSSAQGYKVTAGSTEIVIDTSLPLTDSSTSEQGE